jgi:hypothetical protein
MRQQHNTAQHTQHEQRQEPFVVPGMKRIPTVFHQLRKVLAFVKFLSHDELFLTPQFASASTTKHLGTCQHRLKPQGCSVNQAASKKIKMRTAVAKMKRLCYQPYFAIKLSQNSYFKYYSYSIVISSALHRATVHLGYYDLPVDSRRSSTE